MEELIYCAGIDKYCLQKGVYVQKIIKWCPWRIAAGVAATGFAITYFQNKADKAGGKYKVVYVKNSK